MRVPLLILALAISFPSLAATVTPVETPAASGAAEPFIAAGGKSLLLSWLEPLGDHKGVAMRVARYENGKWSAPSTVVSGDNLFANWADFPSVVEDGAGVLFAHWLQRSGSSTYAYDVRMATSSDRGRTWSKSFLLNRDGRKAEHGFVSLVPLSAGGVGAAWLDGRRMVEGKEEGEMTLRYARVDRRGTLHEEKELDARTCECCATGMALARSGPAIVYRDRSADEIRDISIVRGGKSWTAPQRVRNDGWKIKGCPVNGPQIDALGESAAVAWFTSADKPKSYLAFSKDGGATFGSAVAFDDGQSTGRVDVAMLDAETAIVTWIEQKSGGAEVRARRVTRDGKRSESVKIGEAGPGRASGFPRLAKVGGDVYVTWTDTTGSAKRVRLAKLSF